MAPEEPFQMPAFLLRVTTFFFFLTGCLHSNQTRTHFSPACACACHTDRIPDREKYYQKLRKILKIHLLKVDIFGICKVSGNTFVISASGNQILVNGEVRCLGVYFRCA